MNRIDANVVLRYLLDDHKELSDRAAQIIDKENIYIATEVICEIVYVLYRVYNVPRKEISEKIKSFIAQENTTCSEPNVIKTALDLYQHENIDFVDCILCAHNKIKADRIITFDKKIESITGRKTSDQQ